MSGVFIRSSMFDRFCARIVFIKPHTGHAMHMHMAINTNMVRKPIRSSFNPNTRVVHTDIGAEDRTDVEALDNSRRAFEGGIPVL